MCALKNYIIVFLMFLIPISEAQGTQKAFTIDNTTAEVRLATVIQPTKISIVVQVGYCWFLSTIGFRVQ
jgi:hypothetical protein